MPPKPDKYFNDYANVVDATKANELNHLLADFERLYSSQLVVAVYSQLPAGAALEDYSQKVFTAWGIGQKDKRNGVLLIVFIQDRKMRIHVGYGLEGALPDALCRRIIENEIAPGFKQGDYGRGLTLGIKAIIDATKGEYKGTGSTTYERRQSNDLGGRLLVFAIAIIIIFILISALKNDRGTVYTRRGRRRCDDWGWTSSSSSSSWGSSSSSSWGRSSSSSDSFSGGGGSSGGGGASGSW